MAALLAGQFDDWRSAVRRARLAATIEEFRDTTSRALQNHPGDGFLLREYVLRVRDEVQLARFVDLLDAGGLTKDLPLEVADVAFMRGLALYYRQRYTSALQSFAEAARQRPGWNWPGFYSARILEERFAPTREYEPLFQAALQDPDLRHQVLANRIYLGRFYGNPGTSSLQQLEESTREPWSACIHAVLRLAAVLPTLPSTREVYATEIARLRQVHGVLIEDDAALLAKMISDYLPPKDALALLAELSRVPGASVAWLVEEARLLFQLGFVSRARSVIASIPVPTQEAQLLWLEKARPMWEELWEDEPFDAGICNNLAWVYAMLGKELDRAEELSRAAILLSNDATASKNTRAAILARQGHWDEARRLFVEARDSDDRPASWSLNEYFVGLCDFVLNHSADANAHLRRALETTLSPLWKARILRSIELAASGGDATDPVFGNRAKTATSTENTHR